jgi:hypothetical protein
MTDTTPAAIRGTALVTGASSGIGAALARLFAASGFDLVLVARREDRLIELSDELTNRHGTRSTVLVSDLGRQNAPADLVARLDTLGICVSVLVNNAGFGLYGPFAATSWDSELDMLRVNIVALTALTKLLLPGMLARRDGRILNVASTAAFQPGPLMAVYYATKAYVLSFSEALANELKGTGVTVTALCPGPTASGFQGTARLEKSRLVSLVRLQTTEQVARAGYEGLMKGKAIVIPGLMNWLGAQSPRILPRSWVRFIVRTAQDPRRA